MCGCYITLNCIEGVVIQMIDRRIPTMIHGYMIGAMADVSSVSGSGMQWLPRIEHTDVRHDNSTDFWSSIYCM